MCNFAKKVRWDFVLGFSAVVLINLAIFSCWFDKSIDSQENAKNEIISSFKKFREIETEFGEKIVLIVSD